MSVPKSASIDQSSLPRAGEFKVELIDPTELAPLKYSADIYGGAVDSEFVELIRKNGITTPIECLPGKTFFSGIRRWAAALKLKMKVVPVIIRYDLAEADPLVIEKLTILANATRKKPKALEVKEVAELLRIEQELAKRRRNSKLKTGNSPRSPESGERGTETTGEAAEIVARVVGRSADTVNKIGQIQDEIDKLKAEGKTEEAAAIEETLKKSVNAAYKQVKESGVRSKRSGHGKKTAKAQAAHERQVNFLQSRVKDYKKTGQKERAAQLKKRMTQAVKGGRGRDLVPLPALFRTEKKLPQPTPFDVDLIDVQSKLECFSTCDNSIARIETITPGAINVVNCGKAAKVLIKEFTAALRAIEKKAVEFRAERAGKGKPARAK